MKSTFVLELEGFEILTFEEMLEKVSNGDEIVLTSRGDQLYWRPRWPCFHNDDTDVQTVS